jgi:hypothetical protein
MKRTYLAVFVFALLLRGGALAPNPTPDAAEYQMLARSLARGDGLVLPVRVRHDETGPVRHDARRERAPLLPLVLAPFEGLDRDPRTVAPGLQCLNAVLAALSCVLVSSIARRRASRRVALAAGFLAAVSPPLLVTSTKILAEPLGLLLILAAIRIEDWPALQGVALGLARLARPESVVALVVVALREKRRLLPLLGFAVVTAVALVAGVATQQSFLLRVGNFRDVMFGAKGPLPAGIYALEHPGATALAILRNAGDLGYFALRYGYAVPVLGLCALLKRDRIAIVAFALALGAACVWSTRDHERFLVAPLALLCIPAAITARRLGPRALTALVLATVLLSVLQFDAKNTRNALSARERGVWNVPEALAERLRALGPDEAFAAVSPWSLSLASGRDGLLLPTELTPDELRSFLAARPEVKVVVLRDVPHDALTPEPRRYARDLASISSSESVAGNAVLVLQTSSKK